jgi:hypothetical protein
MLLMQLARFRENNVRDGTFRERCGLPGKRRHATWRRMRRPAPPSLYDRRQDRVTLDEAVKASMRAQKKGAPGVMREATRVRAQIFSSAGLSRLLRALKPERRLGDPITKAVQVGSL